MRIQSRQEINSELMMRQQRSNGLPIALVLILFFTSGATGLVYQVVWTRMMMHVFGSTAIAVGTVLAAFMSGLAIGAWYFGKRADRSHNGLRFYAMLEIGIAVAALVSHLLLHQLTPAHRMIFELTGSVPVIFSVVRFLMAFVLIMVPTLLMGATLPVLARYLQNTGRVVGVNLSTLYATNTFGAVTGVLITGFFLIGSYGIHIPVYLALGCNLLIGGIAWFASARELPADTVSTAHINPPPEAGTGKITDKGMERLILFGLGLSGLTSFAYEIYWTRSLVFILGNSTYALTAMLAAFLTGIAIGGYGIRFPLKHIQDRPMIFGWTQVLLGIFSAMGLPLLFAITDPQKLSLFLMGNSSKPFLLVFSEFGIAFLVMLVPAILIGASFPLVGDLATRNPRETGSAVGRVYAVNTLGNVLGALLPGLILLNWLGIQKGILAMATINVSLGFMVIFLQMSRRRKNGIWLYALPVAVVIAGLSLSRAPLDFQFPSDGEREYFQTLFYREGPLATTKVYVNPKKSEKHISVDGIVIGGTGYSEFKQLLLAHLPKLLLDNVSSELSVGVGSGMLLGESAAHSRLHEITGVEIEPGVVKGASFFAEENHGVLDDPRLRIVVDDIGSFLRTNDQKFQVISADEKTADEYASNGFSYSIEYYNLLREHLAEGGLAMQWVPTTLPPELYRMVLKTFSESFPYVQLWYFLPAHKQGPFNTMLAGSNSPISLNLEQMRRRFDEDTAALASLEPYGLTSADAVLPHFVAAETTIRAVVRDDPINSLEHPRYEFYYPWDYARERETQFIANHALIVKMKLAAIPGLLASQNLDNLDTLKLRQTLAAEQRYLAGFQKFLEGMTLDEQYRVFDDALAVAPWNDSLRARIFAQYSFIASTQRDPVIRARLFRRANALYPDNE